MFDHMIPAILILVVFAIAATLMFLRKLPALLALPAMAFIVAFISGVSLGYPWAAPTKDDPSLSHLLFDTVLSDGSILLAKTMMFAIFGSVLSQVVMRQGIAQRIVRVAAEYAGDQKMLLAFLMTGVVAINFSAISGLGAVIMVGSLVLPILVGSGLSAGYAGSLILFGIAAGGMFQPSNLGFYTDLLKIDKETALHTVMPFAVLLALTVAAFIIIEGRKEKASFAWAATIEAPKSVPLPALLTPIWPIILLVLPWTQWPILPAFIFAILWGVLTTEPKKAINNLTAAILEGLKDVAPVLGLFIGIGMTVKAMTDPATSQIMEPFIKAVLPQTAAGYVTFFVLLAPLTLYRGPFNLYGLGAGFAVLMAKSGMQPGAVMAAFLTVGQMQSVCDPTNTHNVWIAQFLQESTDKFLRRTIFYVWGYVAIALTYAVVVLKVI